jgi:hypothetical protein
MKLIGVALFALTMFISTSAFGQSTWAIVAWDTNKNVGNPAYTSAVYSVASLVGDATLGNTGLYNSISIATTNFRAYIDAGDSVASTNLYATVTNLFSGMTISITGNMAYITFASPITNIQFTAGANSARFGF